MPDQEYFNHDLGLKADSGLVYCGVAVFFLVLLIAPVVFFFNRAERITLKEAEIAVKTGISEKYKDKTTTEFLDYWDKKIVFRRTASVKKIVYKGVSAGEDGEFNTDDDISFVKERHNVAGILGAVGGEIGKRAWEGAKKGWNKESEFKDEE